MRGEPLSWQHVNYDYDRTKYDYAYDDPNRKKAGREWDAYLSPPWHNLPAWTGYVRIMVPE